MNMGVDLRQKINLIELNYYFCHGLVATEKLNQFLLCIWAQLQHVNVRVEL
jgi:hypothetical protein